jgi:hypothetical protein
VQQVELHRQRLSMAHDERVHAARVVLQLMELVGRQRAQGAIGRCAHLQVALNAIMLEQRWPKHLGQFPCAVAAQYIHLPQPVLSSDKSLCEEQVVQVRGRDGRHTVCIACNGHRCGETFHGEVAVKLRQRRVHRMAHGDRQCEHADDQQHDYDFQPDDDAPDGARVDMDLNR